MSFGGCDAVRWLEGTGLHTGEPCRVALRARPGPLAFVSPTAEEVSVDGLRVVDTARAVTVAGDGIRIGTVDHLFAALGGLGIRAGLAIRVEGPELPLLDGASATWCSALRKCLRGAWSPGEPSLHVRRAGEVPVGESHFHFEPGPLGCTVIEVHGAWDDPRLATHARWDGDAVDFEERVAPARTFAFEHEVRQLWERGLARHVSPESVVVLTSGEPLWAGRPFTFDEPIRHKLLDLVGDLYVHGGPPNGSVRAFRPGHGATHRAVERALAEGILGRQPK